MMTFAPLFLFLSREFGWTPAEIMATPCKVIKAYLDAAAPKKPPSKALDWFIKMIPQA